jgi:hypothetical protein
VRYYKLIVGSTTWTSLVNGRTDPGALNVELDIPVSSMGIPSGAAFVRVWGISLQTIGQSNNLNGQPIQVFGGMAPGLPLATAAAGQTGQLIQGTVQQAFGNWVGVDQTLDMFALAGVGTLSQPKNIVHNATKGMAFATAIQNTLTTAFPGFKLNINISPNLVLPVPDVGYFQTLTQYAAYIKQATRAILGGSCPGVDIAVAPDGNGLNVGDGVGGFSGGSSSSTPKMISYQDLIGQPTWIGPGEIQFKTMMRADIKLQDQVQLPQTIITTQPQSNATQPNQILNFSGRTYAIKQIRHVGNFRQPDSASWCTMFNAYPNNTQLEQ